MLLNTALVAEWRFASKTQPLAPGFASDFLITHEPQPILGAYMASEESSLPRRRVAAACSAG